MEVGFENTLINSPGIFQSLLVSDETSVFSSSIISSVVVSGNADALVLEIDTTQAGSASDTFILPAGNTGTYDAVIDWGDGTTSEITAYNDADLSHTYSSGGTYTVTITGTFPYIRFVNGGDKAKLTKILQWGNVGFESFLNAFLGCSNLSELPNGPITGADTVTDFRGCFQTTGITTIPPGLFDNCTQVTRFDACFQDTSITSIPSGLFDNCTLVANFSACFANSNITSIPTGLFDNCTLVTSFAYCFFGCTGLNNNASAFDADLFRYNTAVTGFNNTFGGVTLETGLYSDLLVSLETYHSNNNVPFHGGYSKYNATGAAARAALINDHSWTITDGGAA